MELERLTKRACVVEGYQVLLRAEADVVYPKEREVIESFYKRLTEKCMAWATDVHGAELRNRFSAVDESSERSRFGIQSYRLSVRCVWETEEHAAILCESRLTGTRGEKTNGYHRMSHVWNLSEQTMLPLSQIFGLFGEWSHKRKLPFVPDGIYPEGENLVLFRNARNGESFSEIKYPFRNNQKSDEKE